jgi:hypothetical protein
MAVYNVRLLNPKLGLDQTIQVPALWSIVSPHGFGITRFPNLIHRLKRQVPWNLGQTLTVMELQTDHKLFIQHR